MEGGRPWGTVLAPKNQALWGGGDRGILPTNFVGLIFHMLNGDPKMFPLVLKRKLQSWCHSEDNRLQSQMQIIK